MTYDNDNEPVETKPITILEAATARGIKANEDGGIPLSEFDRVGLPLFGGCEACQASLAAFNMYPSKSGYVRCRECVGDTGFETVEAFEAYHDALELSVKDDSDARILRAHAQRLVNDLAQLQRVAEKGHIQLPKAFMEAKFAVAEDDPFLVTLEDNIGIPAMTDEGVTWEIGFEVEVPSHSRMDPPDYDFETIFDKVPAHYAFMYVVFLYTRLDIINALEQDAAEAYEH